jgi:antitoxin YefM
MYKILYDFGGVVMLATNYSNARQRFAHYCDEAVHNNETVIVTRKRDENVVIMSMGEYNNLLENLFVRRNKRDYDELLHSISHLKAGKGKRREIAEDE